IERSLAIDHRQRTDVALQLNAIGQLIVSEAEVRGRNQHEMEVVSGRARIVAQAVFGGDLKAHQVAWGSKPGRDDGGGVNHSFKKQFTHGKSRLERGAARSRGGKAVRGHAARGANVAHKTTASDDIAQVA